MRNQIMKITVKLFGRYKKITGKNKLELNIGQGNTIWDVINIIVKKYPQLEKEKKFIMVSHNNTYTTVEATIKNGDEITLSPPIVGGG